MTVGILPDCLHATGRPVPRGTPILPQQTRYAYIGEGESGPDGPDSLKTIARKLHAAFS